MNGKNLLMATFISVVWLTLVFTPLSGQQDSTYDPWLDYNNDGIIDTYDLAALASVYGTSGEPKNWKDLLLELQSRVDSLNSSLIELQDQVSTIEEETNQVKTIRFYDPSEYVVDEYDVWINGSTFEWIPENSTNNVLLQMCAYAEVKGFIGPPGGDVASQWHGVIYVENLWRETYISGSFNKYEDFNYTWTETFFSQSTHWIPANQPNYVFQSRFKATSGIAYYRNINIIITVIDGLTASN